MSDGGKGSSPRPFSVDRKTFENNWDSIFSKKKEESKEQSGYNSGVECLLAKQNVVGSNPTTRSNN